MLADYLQRDAERASGLEDTDEAKSKVQLTHAFIPRCRPCQTCRHRL